MKTHQNYVIKCINLVKGKKCGKTFLTGKEKGETAQCSKCGGRLEINSDTVVCKA